MKRFFDSDQYPTIRSFALKTDDERMFDFLMVETIRNEMLDKLYEKREEGRGGWHHPNNCSNKVLLEMLRDHIKKGDMIDVINFAAMIFCRAELYGESTTS